MERVEGEAGVGGGVEGGYRPVEGCGPGEAGPHHILHPLRNTLCPSRSRGPKLRVLYTLKLYVLQPATVRNTLCNCINYSPISVFS